MKLRQKIKIKALYDSAIYANKVKRGQISK